MNVQNLQWKIRIDSKKKLWKTIQKIVWYENKYIQTVDDMTVFGIYE